MTNFTAIFVLALLVNCGITFRSSEYWKKLQSGQAGLDNDAPNELAVADKKRWESLLRRYLIVYLLATVSDWLQGPYVYALYDAYGYSQHDIAVLFVAGFGSSMVFGSFIGGMADWAGRRTFVIVYAVVYALSCLTKRKILFRYMHL
jgi:predicted MFS family arabinose efflux permease